MHLDNFDKKYFGDSDKDTEMPDVKHITTINNPFISERTTTTQSKSSIQSTWSGFKSIKFDDD